MKSSSGVHFIALDHVRAMAAFMVFSWHFVHNLSGFLTPFAGAPAFVPMALLDEGHTGVALFMTLSGYLFAKLLDGRRLHVWPFLWNRAIRLLPLLILLIALRAIWMLLQHHEVMPFLWLAAQGLVWPTLPNGGWSITTEFHFYLLLPLLLWLAARWRGNLLVLVGVAVLIRTALYLATGQIQNLAYWTIVGRIDQFTLGMVAFLYSREISRRPLVVVASSLAFMAFWWWFDWAGGFYALPSYPSTHPVWIVLPTFEGAAYGLFIAWYDAQAIDASSWWSRVLQRFGDYSYSIYLLHFFVVFRLPQFIHQHVMNLSNFYVAQAWAVVTFACMLVPGYLTFRFIERPFLSLRRPYSEAHP